MTYETVSGDTWDIIAKSVYEDEKYAGYLMANNRVLLDYVIFPAGVKVECPELEEEEDSDSPIWRD
jgi:phage tail protein X